MVIVDAHNHLVWPNRGADAHKPTILDPASLIAAGVISKAWVLSTGDCLRHPYADQDEAVLDLARKFPKFCIPFAYLDFEKPPETVDRFAARGFAGLKAIFPHKPYDDESLFPFYEKAQQHRMPIMFHVGGAGYDPPDVGLFANKVFPYRAATRNMLIETLDLIVKVFPKLNVVAAHMGGNAGFESCLRMTRHHPNFYFDVSCSPLARGWLERTREVIEYVGPDKILYGSDNREEGPNTWAQFWKYYLMTRPWSKPEYVTKILGGNAERIIAESGYDPAKIK